MAPAAPVRSSEEHCHTLGGIKAHARFDVRESTAKALFLRFQTPEVTPAKDDVVLRKGLCACRARGVRRA